MVGAHSPVESGSLGIFEAESHFADEAVTDLEMPAGTGEEDQAVGACMDVGKFVVFEQEGEGRE